MDRAGDGVAVEPPLLTFNPTTMKVMLATMAAVATTPPITTLRFRPAGAPGVLEIAGPRCARGGRQVGGSTENHLVRSNGILALSTARGPLVVDVTPMGTARRLSGFDVRAHIR